MPRPSDHDGCESTPVRGSLHRWVLGLPWVVERPYRLGVAGTRGFAVDCKLAGVRSVWLVTGLPNGSGIGVVVPEALGADLDLLGLAEPLAPMPPEHVFAVVGVGVDQSDLERLLIAAYNAAFAVTARSSR